MTHPFRSWLPLAVVLTLTCGVIYLTAQQFNRSLANDLPTQLAQDVADRLRRNVPPAGLVGSVPIDMATSLAPFIIILDRDGNTVITSAELKGMKPTPPKGVMADAKIHGESRITWQPDPDTRVAIVVVAARDSQERTVIAGHSLKETESRIALLGKLIALAWAASLALSYGAVWLMSRR